MIQEKLKILWLNIKEINVYVYLIEYWISAASEIAHAIEIPKSSVNFLADNLWKRGILTKSFRGKTGYFEADISSLKQAVLWELSSKEKALEKLIPILEEKNKNIISKPKINFIDGVENCKKEYLELLTVEKFYEFGAHEDLKNAFGQKFMKDFIDKRVDKSIFCDSIWTDWNTEINLQKLDAQQKRELKIFSAEKFWKIRSSIAIYSNKVLILNLKWAFTGVLIENKEFAQTMKTVFLICSK